MDSDRTSYLGERGFANGSLYDEVRPDYPEASIATILAAFGLNRSSRVLDLGAGTGIFTRQLQAHVGEVVAVEPSPSMRETMLATTLGVTVLDGRDDAIPLEDASVDAVVVAQAFHWFDAPRALAEIHRVLVPGGGLALIWNERDESNDWMAALTVAMRWDVHRPYSSNGDVARVVGEGPFEDVERHQFDLRQWLTRDQVYRRVLTTSYISIMGEDDQRALLADVRRVVEPLGEPIDFAYRTDLYTARASGPAR
jgi:SAM-dependent methyltransferase